MSQAFRNSANTLYPVNLCALHQTPVYGRSIPKFGIGSINCEGNENRTFAISDTPINLNQSPELARSSSVRPALKEGPVQ